MTQVAVDTLQSVRELRDADIEPRKAEAIASMTHRAISDSQAHLVTKADLSAFRSDFAVFRSDFAVFRSDFATFKSDLSVQLAKQEARLLDRISAVDKRVSEVDSRVSEVDSRFHRTIWAHSIAIVGLTVALLRFL